MCLATNMSTQEEAHDSVQVEEPESITDENRCPICIMNLDEAWCGNISPCMCTVCGQSFCGECKTNLHQLSIKSCPMCKMQFEVPAEVQYTRLLNMVQNRSVGRHTHRAQFYIGGLYIKGRGVIANLEEVLKWFRMAANGGYSHAQYHIGLIYTKGVCGLKQDDIEARRWFTLAAAQKHPLAQLRLE